MKLIYAILCTPAQTVLQNARRLLAVCGRETPIIISDLSPTGRHEIYVYDPYRVQHDLIQQHITHTLYIYTYFVHILSGGRSQ